MTFGGFWPCPHIFQAAGLNQQAEPEEVTKEDPTAERQAEDDGGFRGDPPVVMQQVLKDRHRAVACLPRKWRPGLAVLFFHTPSLSLEILGGGTPKHFLKLFQFQPPPFQFWKVFNLSYFSFFSDIFGHNGAHSSMHAYIHTYIHPCMHTYMHTYIHACMHAYIHTCIYKSLLNHY